MKYLGLIIAAAIFLFVAISSVSIFSMWMNYSNQEVQLKNAFTQKLDERTAFYDKMIKIFAGKYKLAVKNDSSYKEVVNAIMTNRKDNQGLFMKWVTEQNPNQDFSKSVTAMYQDMSRTIEAERNGFFEQEKLLQDIKLQHDNLLDVMPSSWFLSGKMRIKYTPIKSESTAEVMRTGIDNDKTGF